MYSLVGISIGAHVALTSIGDGYEFFPVYAGVSAFITTSFIWWVFLERRKISLTIIKGAVAGIFSGIISHYICWYIILAVANFRYLIFGTALSSLGEPPQNLLIALWASLVYSVWSLVFYG